MDKEKRLKFLYNLEAVLFGLVIAGCLALVIWRFFGDPIIRVTRPAMEPTYRDGDLVVCTRTVKAEELDYGDIVIFKDPEGESRHLIKRVIGRPGDTVRVTTGGVFVNGEKLIEDYPAAEKPGIAENDVVLSDDEFFLLGDNRNNSRDSRAFGPLKITEIEHKVKRVFDPLKFLKG